MWVTSVMDTRLGGARSAWLRFCPSTLGSESTSHAPVARGTGWCRDRVPGLLRMPWPLHRRRTMGETGIVFRCWLMC